jgi:hypothetical protein
MPMKKTWNDKSGTEHIDAYWVPRIAVIEDTGDSRVQYRPFKDKATYDAGLEPLGKEEDYRVYFIPKAIVMNALKTPDANISAYEKLEIYVRDYVKEVLNPDLTKTVNEDGTETYTVTATGEVWDTEAASPLVSYFHNCEIIDV